jgi:surface antigen
MKPVRRKVEACECNSDTVGSLLGRQTVTLSQLGLQGLAQVDGALVQQSIGWRSNPMCRVLDVERATLSNLR